MKALNEYNKMQKEFYSPSESLQMLKDNHRYHNDNPDYWNILLSPLKDETNHAKKYAMDFGCGCGRNIENMINNYKFSRVDGVDISDNNILNCKKYLENNIDVEGVDCELFVNNGFDLSEIKDEMYDFVMSTIVFQHIKVYSIRFNLIKEIYRTLKLGGIFSMQMGYGTEHPVLEDYYSDRFLDDPERFQSGDVCVDDKNKLINDFKKIGFNNIEVEIRDSWKIPNAIGHEQWIYIIGKK